MEGVEWDKVCGRGGIKMGWAKKKLKEGEEPESKPKTKAVKVVEKKEKVVREKREWIDYDAEDAPPRPAHGFDHASSRTVIIQGIPIPLTEEERAAKKAKKEADAAAKMEVDSDDEAEAEEPEEGGEEVDEETGKPVDWKKALKQKAKKTGDVEDVQWPVLLASGESVGAFIFSLSPFPNSHYFISSHDRPSHSSPRPRTHEEAPQPRLPRARRERLRQKLLGPRPAPRSRQGWRTPRRP